MFGDVINVPVKGHRIGDAQLLGSSHQAVLPPTTADHIEVQFRNPGTEHRDGVEGVLDLFMRHQPGQHHRARGSRPLAGQGVRRRLIEAIAHHSHPVRVDAEVDEIAHGRQRDCDVLVVAVQTRRKPRLHEPAEPAQEPAGDGPLIAVTVVHQHDDAATEGQSCQERQTVLAVDHHIRPRTPQRTQADP